MNARLQALLQSKHTSAAAVLYALCELATIWLPDFKVQLDNTQDWIFVYALIFAGDAKPVAKPEEPAVKAE